jgi:hypothetical protein
MHVVEGLSSGYLEAAVVPEFARRQSPFPALVLASLAAVAASRMSARGSATETNRAR